MAYPEKDTVLSPDAQILNATEGVQMALAELGKAAMKAEADRRVAATSAAVLDEAHHRFDAAQQELHTTLDRFDLGVNYPQVAAAYAPNKTTIL